MLERGKALQLAVQGGRANAHTINQHDILVAVRTANEYAGRSACAAVARHFNAALFLQQVDNRAGARTAMSSELMVCVSLKTSLRCCQYLATAERGHFARCRYLLKCCTARQFDAGVQLRQNELRGQAPDHPVLWNVEETDC